MKTVKIEKIIRETPQTVTLILDRKIEFVPGQYANFEFNIDGQKLQREYSFSSSPDENLAITIKEEVDGTVSKYVQNTQPGTELKMSEPMGNFVLNKNTNDHVFIATGSGITPIFSILKSLPTDHSAMLVYGNKTPESTIFLKEITELRENEMFRIQMLYSQSDESDLDRVTEYMQEGFGEANVDDHQISFYICGNGNMVTDVKKILQKSKARKIITESFTDSEVQGIRSGKSYKLTILTNGKVVEIEGNTNETVLDTLIANNIEIAYKCKKGNCGQCEAQLVSGEVEHLESNSLPQSEVDKGWILTCRAYSEGGDLNIKF